MQSGEKTKAGSNFLILKSNDEIKRMRDSSVIVAEILSYLEQNICAGISTYQIDKIAENQITKFNAISSFKGYCGYPACTCISINEQVVHGIPSKNKLLYEGDIVSIDLGVLYKGYHGDAAVTFSVGEVSNERRNKRDTTNFCQRPKRH